MDRDPLAMLETNLLQHLGPQEAGQWREHSAPSRNTDAFKRLPSTHQASKRDEDDWEDIDEEMPSANDASASRHTSDFMASKMFEQQRPNKTTTAVCPRKTQKPRTNGQQTLSTASTAVASPHTGQISPHERESDVEALRNDIRAGALLAELFSGDEAKALNSVLETQPLLGQFLSRGLSRKDADTAPSLAQSFSIGKDQEAEQTGRLQLQTRSKTNLSQDPATTKQINRFVRRHKFVTEQCFEQYTTAQRRAFERDVYDYARSLKLRKQAAKVAVREARKICGEVDYDTDESRLDEDEMDDSESSVIGLPSSISLKPLPLPAASQIQSDANDVTTQAMNQAKRKLDSTEDQSNKRSKPDEGPALQYQTVEHHDNGATAGNALTVTQAKADQTANPIARATAESSGDGQEDNAGEGRAEQNSESDGVAAPEANNEASPNHVTKGINSNSQIDNNNHSQHGADGHPTNFETRNRIEEKHKEETSKPQRSIEELKSELQSKLASVRKMDMELDLVFERRQDQEIDAPHLQNIRNGMKLAGIRKDNLLQIADELVAIDPTLGSTQSPSSTAWKTLIDDLALKRQESWNDGPNSQLDLMNKARTRNEVGKNIAHLLAALNEEKQSNNNWVAEQLLLAYQEGSVTVKGFSSILSTVRQNDPSGLDIFKHMHQTNMDVPGCMSIVEEVTAKYQAVNAGESGESDDGSDEEDETVDEENETVDEGDEGADEEEDDSREIKSEEGHGNHNTALQGQNNLAEASNPVVFHQPWAPISKEVETAPAKSDDEVLRLYRKGEMRWHDGLQILGHRYSDS
ncbi:MAG: hypothetical protein Q9183_002440, partial [Haloplaca sp. 2 TL-2023]